MKKLIGLAMILCLLLVTCALAGCGGGSSDGEQNEPAEVTENAGAENPETSEDTLTLEEIFTRSSSIESLTFEWEMTGANGVASNGTEYIQGSNIRMDMNAQGMGQVTMLYNADTREAWMINLDENTAMKLGSNDAETESVNPLEPLTGYPQDMYNIVGQETIDGKKCTVIEMTDDNGYTKMWVWEQYGFPLKMEMIIEGNQINYEYKNVSFDTISDSVFEVPAGVQIIDMQMPDIQGMQNMGQQ